MPDDPFTRLGLPQQFDVDPAALERQWLMQTARLHPDRAPDPDAAAREMAQVNDARAVLADPEQRANALLKARGGPSSSDDNALPDGFLMEIFELREAMEQVMANRDPDAIKAIEADAAERRDAYIATVTELFARDDANVHTTIRRELNAWRYIERMIEQLDPEYDPNAADFS